MDRIELKNIYKSYGDVAVLTDLSISIGCGECTAIMGQSGCGKTTLLRILMGLDRDYSGEVIGMPERFAAVFQENRLCEEFSVTNNVRMAAEIKGKEEEINKILSELGLADQAMMKVSELSGGQKRRVALARALVFDAGLIIMDEPFKGLDDATKRMAAATVRKRKHTIIMVTHDPEEAVLMDAKVICMPARRRSHTENRA